MTTSPPELTTTGEHLAGARSARGLSIEDVAHATRIPASHIRGLEAGDYEGFDGVAYAKSFLRLYGNYLGVDVTDGLILLGEHRELSGKSHHYPFLDVPEKVRFASEMKAPRSSTVPLIAVVLGMLLVVTVPIGVLLAKRFVHPMDGKNAPTMDSVPAGDAVQIDLIGNAKVPDGQLERIRTQREPEVRRAEVVEDDATASEGDGNDPETTADAHVDEEAE